jgi:predicted flap endonuclease-1-like 5' DNA nuclease
MRTFGYFGDEGGIIRPVEAERMDHRLDRPTEQTSQADPAASEATPAPAGAELAGGDEALREELAKWRERVPKLAAALRQRTEEADALKQELERLRRAHGDGQSGAAGIRAREELITELEGRLSGLAERHKSAQGELHKRQLQIEELKGDLDAWKGKWQSVTRALDEQAAQVSDRDQRFRSLENDNERLRRHLAEQVSAQEAGQCALNEAMKERDSLRRRNEQLFETTELANRQIGSLTDSLAELRARLKQHREQEAGSGAEREAVQAELVALRARLTEGEERLRRALDAGERAERAALIVTEELHLVSAAAAASLGACAEADARVAEAHRASAGLQAALDEQGREVERLTDVVEVAERTTRERENERRELSERLQAMVSRNEHLEQQLGERSVLVVGLEQDRAEAKARQALQQQRDELEESLIRAERNAKENAEHIAQLDAKLERQQEHTACLEAELAGRESPSAGASLGDPESENARLKEQVRKLEGLVRERTEALNRLEWQLRLAEAGARPAASAGTVESGDDGDGKLLLVLNQQLADARARTAELVARVRQLEAERQGGAARGPGDDLTRIHGVGQKLAEQLNDLGIYHYQQIAELEEADLADEGHVLHAHRGRIARDGWIDQAVKLISH